MDLNSLKDTVTNLSLYDLKAGVRKVQNAVMNYTEMEAKVREATNNEPWGASSTLMQEIANGTYSYQLLNEIMPMIYKRFTEKAAEEWRQIYKVGTLFRSRSKFILKLSKALQLLEFLIKNGSERVIDDARGHLSLLKMLRQFQFIDQNGKDQGLNVRNRSKELAELLGDVDRIRAERKKARSNRNKFGGVEGGGGFSGGMSSGSRYGGFSNEDASFGGYTGGTYGDGGGFGGNTSTDFHDSGTSTGVSGNTSRRDRFEEYDEEDDGAVSAATSRRKAETATTTSAKRKPEVKKEPEVDLFSFGDDDVPPMTPPKPAPSNVRQAIASPTRNGNGTADDDDFDDFISATPTTQTSSASRSTFSGLAPPTSTSSVASSTQFAAPKPVSASQGATLNDLVGFSSVSPAPSNATASSTFSSPPLLSQPLYQQQAQAQPPRPTGYQAAQPNYFTSVPVPPQGAASKPSVTSAASFGASKPGIGGAKSSGGEDAFGNLWSTASASAGIKKPTTGTQGPNLASMAKEKASQGMWGTASSSTASLPLGGAAAQQRPMQAHGQKMGGSLDDLLG
ncbi:Epsin-3, clathrin recruitment and traffic between the Golgi and endosome [Lambiella insularis]|nr:Epsin-3, clathrin recruitment and traffic between the Golgi and endosome [Lambiella insularis]